MNTCSNMLSLAQQTITQRAGTNCFFPNTKINFTVIKCNKFFTTPVVQQSSAARKSFFFCFLYLKIPNNITTLSVLKVHALSCTPRFAHSTIVCQQADRKANIRRCARVATCFPENNLPLRRELLQTLSPNKKNLHRDKILINS